MRLDELYLQQPNTFLEHPYFSTNISTTAASKWPWFRQAAETYGFVEKQPIRYPKLGDLVKDTQSGELVLYKNKATLENHPAKANTIPVDLKPLKSRKNTVGFLVYRLENHPNVLNHVIKAPLEKWAYGTKMMLPEFAKMKKLSLSAIIKVIRKLLFEKGVFRATWTSTQQTLIDIKVQLSTLLSNKLKTVIKVDDFRRKVLMMYWNHLGHKCHFCEEDFDPLHLLNKCSHVKKWEEALDNSHTLREIRKECQFLNDSDQHLFSWITNWCLWKCYWDVVYKKIKDWDSFHAQVRNLEKYLKEFEYTHIKYLQLVFSDQKREKLLHQLGNFRFFSLENENIVVKKRENISFDSLLVSISSTEEQSNASGNISSSLASSVEASSTQSELIISVDVEGGNNTGFGDSVSRSHSSQLSEEEQN